MMAHVTTYLQHTKGCIVQWGYKAIKTCNVYRVGNYNVLYRLVLYKDIHRIHLFHNKVF